MNVWIFVVIGVVAAFTVLALLRKSKNDHIEHFQNASGLTSTPVGGMESPPSRTFADFITSLTGGSRPPSLKAATTRFVSGQQDYLQNVLNREVMTNSLMPDYGKIISPAVNQPDVYLNTPDNIIVQNLELDNASQFSEADMQFCRSAQMPENLPPHIRGGIVGCGWYYIPDPNMTSSGALGQADGPLFPKGLEDDGKGGIPNYGNGQWIWNLELAQQLEAIKNCARIKTCIGIDAPSVKGICGFCIPSGKAIPVNTDGTEKYPNSLRIGDITAPAAVCDAVPLMNSVACNPARPPAPVITPQGINCGTFGYPSPDYSIRLYSQNDCAVNMNGNWTADGQCMGQNGQSLSAACKALNGVKPSAPGPTLCSPDINGKLSNACLISLAQGVGLTSQGSIIKMLKARNVPDQFDTIAVQIIRGENINVNRALYEGGIISVSDAVVGYDKIYSLIKGGSTNIIQQAAMWLCIGTTGFDPCNLPDKTPGPFFDQCIQQQWRIAGCQPAGTSYPSQKESITQLNTLTWGGVKKMFQDTYNAITATDPVQQDIAVQRCLGITTQRYVDKPCTGISRNGMIMNLDGSAFSDSATSGNYTMNGAWTSVNAVYIGPAVVSGTRVTDKLGAQFDGTTVIKSPNLIAQALGQPPVDVLDGPAPGTIVESGKSRFPPFPAALGGPAIQGSNPQALTPPVPIALFSTDSKGNTVYGVMDGGYMKLLNSKNECKYSSDDISSYAPNKWDTYWPSSPGAYTVIMSPMFSAAAPIMTIAGPLKDIGYPGGGLGIGGDQSTYFAVAGTALTQWQPKINGDFGSYLQYINVMMQGPAAQALKIKLVSNFGDTFTAPCTTVAKGGWFVYIQGSGPSPVSPIGGYYVKQNGGRNLPQFSSWDSASSATMTLEIDPGPIAESRELWINPNTQTCEILAVNNGVGGNHTAMALYKGNLVIALKSVEKGYTFFNVEGGNIPVGQWTHIVHTYIQGKNKVYINGIGPIVMNGLTRVDYNGFMSYWLGGGSAVNPLYQKFPTPMPFQGGIGAFRVYNRELSTKDVQNNLGATIGTYVNQVQMATKNDPNQLAMAGGQYYVPSLISAINYQANPDNYVGGI